MATRNGQTQAQVTPAEQWRKPREEGYVVELPSGNVARLRPVALDVLIRSGKLPDLLTPVAAKTLWQETPVEEIAGSVEVGEKYTDLINLICRASFMEPEIVDEDPGEGQVLLEDVDFYDRTTVFNVATAGATALRRFRDRQARDVDAVPDKQDDPVAAE